MSYTRELEERFEEKRELKEEYTKITQRYNYLKNICAKNKTITACQELDILNDLMEDIYEKIIQTNEEIKWLSEDSRVEVLDEFEGLNCEEQDIILYNQEIERLQPLIESLKLDLRDYIEESGNLMEGPKYKITKIMKENPSLLGKIGYLNKYERELKEYRDFLQLCELKRRSSFGFNPFYY